MIYPKKIKLDQGDQIENRILKTDKIRLVNYDFVAHIKQYIQGLEIQLKACEFLSKDLDFFYFGQTLYENLIYDLKKAFKHREEIMKKEITSIKKQLEKIQNIEKKFKPIRPYIKNYFKQKKNLQKYEKKLPKLKIKMETKTKLKGQLSDKETKKLLRNEKKLKDCSTEFEIVQQKLIEETNKINIERFTWINPVMKEFISCMLSDCYMNQDNYHKLDNYENILAQKQTPDLNERFFFNVKQQSKVFYQNVQPINQQNSIYKKNVQNNYYYINGQNQQQQQNINQQSQQNNENIDINNNYNDQQYKQNQLQYTNQQLQYKSEYQNHNQNLQMLPNIQQNENKAIPLPNAQHNPQQAIPLPNAQQNPNQPIPLPACN